MRSFIHSFSQLLVGRYCVAGMEEIFFNETQSLSPGLYSLVFGGLGREWRAKGDCCRVYQMLRLYLCTLNLRGGSGKTRS